MFYFNKPKWDNKTGAIKGLLKNKWGEEEKRRKGRKTLKKEKKMKGENNKEKKKNVVKYWETINNQTN